MSSYTANALNQYTQRTEPGYAGVRGSATNTATVTVNGNAALSDSIASDTVPWHYALTADNANGGAYTFASIMAVVNPPGTNTPDIVESTSGSVYAPPQAEVLTYDDDGNLLSDGRFNYTWNGENRLIKAEEQVCPTNRTLRKVDYAYDHQGRMVWKKISRGGAEAQSWEDEKATSYLWDSFNIIAETYVADSATNVTYNVWGLDIDGTLQGAGGVGGLLAVVSPLPLGESQGEGGTVYLPCYDANGNIMEYVSSDGTIAAHREYDPFGGTVVATGDVDVFTHWFSTKPWCSVTQLSEYQFRKYNPTLGRWLSRDPLGERGGVQLYSFSRNSPVMCFDKDGRILGAVVGGIVGAALGGISAAILGGDIGAGIVGGAVSGALLGAGVPPQIAGAIGGAIGGFVGAYNTAKEYPNVCSSTFGLAMHYSTRVVLGGVAGYWGGALGENFGAAMEGSIISASLTINGHYVISTADVIMQGTIDISLTATETYLISLPETGINAALSIEPVSQTYELMIDSQYKEIYGECLCPTNSYE